MSNGVAGAIGFGLGFVYAESGENDKADDCFQMFALPKRSWACRPGVDVPPRQDVTSEKILRVREF